MAQSTTASFRETTNYGAQIGQNHGSVIYNLHTAATPTILPAQPPLPSAIIPFRRDRDFIERDILNDLWKRASGPAARVGLVGLGGVGKTQLAIEYAYRVRNDYPDRWVFWVHASSAARFEESYKMIAELVRPGGWSEPKADTLEIVHRWLSDNNNGQWTMVVDNADSEEVMLEPWAGEKAQPTTASLLTSHSLSDYLPRSENGLIVITSRNQKVMDGLIEYTDDVLDVKAMTPEEAVSLLTRKLKKLDGTNTVQADFAELARQLECLPLAITQAASYIYQRAPRMTVSRYLEILKGGDEERAKLLLMDIRDPRRDGGASNSIIATWHISFEHLRHSRHSAARLLALMSLFNREGIPDQLLRNHYIEDLADEIDFEEDIATLTAYSLISVGVSDNVFEMHRLVQFSTKTWLKVHDELNQWQERYVEILGEAFPNGDYTNWSICQTLFPHVEAIRGYQLVSEKHRLIWATIQYRGAWYASEVGRYAVSERMARSSFEAREAILGVSNAQTLYSMNRLAIELYRRGKYKEAEEISRQALAGSEKELGVDHRETITTMNNLALVLRRRGKYEESESLNRRALAGSEKELGVDHPDTLTSVSNLASLLQDQGIYKEAETLHRRVLAEREKKLGKDHPNTLTSVYNLAYLLDQLRNSNQALDLYDRAATGYDRVLGPGHPTTLACQRHRASLLEKLSRT